MACSSAADDIDIWALSKVQGSRELLEGKEHAMRAARRVQFLRGAIVTRRIRHSGKSSGGWEWESHAFDRPSTDRTHKLQ
jgi:hypothetical protein